MTVDEYISKQAFNDAIRGAVRKCPDTFYNGLETARQIAHELPAADVATVVHGRWLDVPGFSYCIECSVCRQKVNHSYYDYCPNCGAKMDGGDGP